MIQQKTLIKVGKFNGYITDGKDTPLGVFKLRHDVFAKKLKWIPGNTDEHDHDEYDDISSNCYVTDEQNAVVGTVRIIDSRQKFMMDKEFQFLVDSEKEYNKTPDSAEISRLAIANVSNKSKVFIIQTLFNLLEHWLNEHDKNYFYFVTTLKYSNKLHSNYGIIVQQIGKIMLTDDNVHFSAFKVHIPSIVSTKNKVKRFLYMNVFRKIFS